MASEYFRADTRFPMHFGTIKRPWDFFFCVAWDTCEEAILFSKFPQKDQSEEKE